MCAMLFSYIDPFTGSLVLQAIAVIFLSILAFFKPIVMMIRGFLGLNKMVQNDINDENADE